MEYIWFNKEWAMVFTSDNGDQVTLWPPLWCCEYDILDEYDYTRRRVVKKFLTHFYEEEHERKDPWDYYFIWERWWHHSCFVSFGDYVLGFDQIYETLKNNISPDILVKRYDLYLEKERKPGINLVNFNEKHKKDLR